jgi:hypothetical protein
MVATVLIRRLTGAGPSATDITSINTRANTVDSHTTADTSNPIKVPTSGTNYSFWVVTRLDSTVTPAGTINNINWYTDGANGFGTGVTCKMDTATGYTQATGTAGVTGLQLTQTNYATLADANPTNAFGFTSGAPKSVTGTISNPTTGQFGDYVVYQIEVGTTAGPGATPQETFTFTYDET